MTSDPAIEAIEAAAYQIPTDAPEGDGTLAWDNTTLVLARVRAGDTEGIGWTYGSAASATVIEHELAPVVQGRPALDVPGSSEAMIRAVRNVTRQGVAGYAISAVDVALWDLKAKLLGLPLYRLLGAVRDEIPVYGSGGFTPYDHDQLRAQLTGWAIEQAIPRVKIKIGESWGTDPARDLARMEQARQIIGDDVELYVDANGGYGRKQAIRVMAAAADLDVRWFEEPVSSDDLDGLREVRDAVVPTWRRASTAGTCTTSAGCARRVRSTACRPTCPAAAASPSGCARPRWPPRSAWRSPGTARRTCTRTRRPRSRTSGTWSGSTTTCGSSRCSSTAPSTRRAARSAWPRTGPGWAWSSGPPTPRSTASTDTTKGEVMAQIASELLIERLADWGVDTVFGLPGDGINGIMEGLRRHTDKIQFFLVHHEEAAAFMATAYAKATGKLGVCLSTSGPGAIHLLNGLYDAKLDHMPVLAITGMQETSVLGTGYQQEVHTESCSWTWPSTTWSSTTRLSCPESWTSPSAPPWPGAASPT